MAHIYPVKFIRWFWPGGDKLSAFASTDVPAIMCRPKALSLFNPLRYRFAHPVQLNVLSNTCKLGVSGV